MSHIAVDLKVIETIAPAVARASGVPEEAVGWGLVRLWHRCWSAKTELATRVQLAGVFGVGDLIDALIDALVGFGLLDPDGSTWRVKGADRYLRIQAGRVAGGKAAQGNLRKGSAPAHSRLTPGSLPAHSRQKPELTPGLSPSTEHRAPSTGEEALALELTSAPVSKPTKATEAGLRLAALSDQLVAVYVDVVGEKYMYRGGPDSAALKRIVGLGVSDELIVARWRDCLTRSGWCAAKTFAQFAAKWNDLAAPAAPSKGPVDPATQKHVSGDLLDF